MKSFSAIALALGCVFGLAVAAQAGEDSPAVETKPDELFKKLDTNGDGVLTASEVPKEHRKFFERLLRIGDANKDGELSREEFDAAMQKSDQPVTDINKAPAVDAGSGAPRAQLDPKKVFQALDKNKDGKLTRDEVEGRPRILAAFDRLGKEELTLEDLERLLSGGGKKAAKGKKKLAAKAAAKAGADKMADTEESSHGLPPFFRLLDTNHDGRLSREELAKAAELFDRLDRNHDGFLDAHELTETPAVASSQEPTITPGNNSPGNSGFGRLRRKKAMAGDQNVVQMLQKADADGDGKLSMEEVPPFLKKQFAKIDTNGDGFLDKGELEVWFRKRRLAAGNLPPGGNPDNSSTPTVNKATSGI